MFIVGLELDLGEFMENKNKSLLFGFYTFIIPIVIGFPVCYYLLGTMPMPAFLLPACLLPIHWWLIQL